MPPPEEESTVGEVPAYMVSFGDMITLLLTFFILLVAMADTQSAGLVGAGQGPLIRHMNAKGEPGIMKGHLIEHRRTHKRDAWWIPDQDGDPDQLEVVREKLEKELVTKFKAHEAKVSYHQDRLAIRLPARIQFNVKGEPIIDEGVAEVLDMVAEIAWRYKKRFIRINGDVADLDLPWMEWSESAKVCRLVYDNLLWRGISSDRMSIWGWGATRHFAFSGGLNRGVTIEMIDLVEQKTEQEYKDTKNEGYSSGGN